MKQTYRQQEESSYVIIRADRAGCFAGEMISRDGSEVVLANARRLWYWAGAASLSQLAMEGTSKPGSCKFPIAMDLITVLGVIEIIDVTPQARASIEAVPVWKA